VLNLSFILLIFFLTYSAQASDKLCSTIVYHGDALHFTETEKRLVCGDKSLEAYKDIPSYEASYIMTGFLQSRGYLSPRYESIDNVLHVHSGKKSFVKKFQVVSNETKVLTLVKHKLRKLFKRRLLSTSTLDSIEAEALSILRQNGYPCSKVKSEVDISKGLVIVYLNHLDFHKFGEVNKEKIPGLRDNALERYYPFTANQTFNEHQLELTEKRMVRSEVVQGTYFIEGCEGKEKFSLSQNFINGPPRTIRFGAGASTEQGPMLRVKWSHNRYKSMASIFSANLQASLRSQSLTFLADSFLWHSEPRRSLLSQAEIVRESQLDYDQILYRLKPHIKWTRDSEGHFKRYELGPSFEAGTYNSKEDTATQNFATGIIEGSAQWTSHEYELYDIHPEAGDSFGLSFDFRHPSLGFTDPLLKLDSSFVKLTHLANWGRGNLIGGLRTIVGTTWVSNDVSLNDLPPAVKYFGGGSDDIRGFQLKTLPQNDGLGALTKLALKLELRRTYVYLESIEAFTFVDMAYFGNQSWEVDPILYYSPGFGLRWLSPIGLVQTFIARALKSHPYEDSGNLIYVGLGGMF
jgi:translocation and assembly module TamA